MRLLLTAFEPYDQWQTNSSWLTLVELVKDVPLGEPLITRRYPVDLPSLQEKLQQDLQRDFDVVLHLGQSPGASSIKLEAIALNAAGCLEERGEELDEIIPGGPLAFRSAMPLGRWSAMLRSNHIPAVVSYHAGTYLCNAIMYLSHYQLQLKTGKKRNPRCRVGFVHLPLASEQVAQHGLALPSLPLTTLARAVRLLVDDLQNADKQSEHVA